jgi:hypothetical protein
MDRSKHFQQPGSMRPSHGTFKLSDIWSSIQTPLARLLEPAILDQARGRERPATSKGASRPFRESHVQLRLSGSKVLGNEKADALAGQEAKKASLSPLVSMTSLKLQISEKYNRAREKWNANPALHGNDSITPPPPKKSCLDGAKNGLARVVAQIRSGYWRSAV